MSAGPSKTLRYSILAASIVAAALAIVRVVKNSSAEGDVPARSASEQPELYEEVPEFSFVSHRGEAFGKTQMLGTISIVNFIFTRCRTVCPVFTMKMKRIAEKTPDTVQLISISVDPDYDTPEVLAAYAKEQGAESERWHFLTGDANAVKDTVEGALKISMENQGLDEEGVPDIVHGGHFVLVDGMGRIRGYYNSDDAERIEVMLKHAAWLRQQEKE